MKLKKINPFYSNCVVNNLLADVGEQNDPTLWNLLTSDDIHEVTLSMKLIVINK